jgi:putative hemolysin
MTRRIPEIAREISYAYSAATKGGRRLIRLMENATGRMRLIQRAVGYEDDVAAGRDFWAVMVERYGLTLDVVSGALANIPKDGPLILIANHPYGILDGMMMGHILSQTRGDFRILANSVFRKAKELDRILLPISFEETKDAVHQNIETRKAALDYLGAGGAIGVFPGGTVSTAGRPFGTPMDPEWRGFTARMIAKSNATVVPMYFDGHTSRLFQIVSHMHPTLRLGLLIKEFKKRIDTPVRVVIGEPIARADLDQFAGDSKQMMDFLRKAAYGLNPSPAKTFELGYEFEQKRRD